MANTDLYAQRQPSFNELTRMEHADYNAGWFWDEEHRASQQLMRYLSGDPSYRRDQQMPRGIGVLIGERREWRRVDVPTNSEWIDYIGTPVDRPRLLHPAHYQIEEVTGEIVTADVKVLKKIANVLYNVDQDTQARTHILRHVGCGRVAIENDLTQGPFYSTNRMFFEAHYAFKGDRRPGAQDMYAPSHPAEWCIDLLIRDRVLLGVEGDGRRLRLSSPEMLDAWIAARMVAIL